MIDQVFGTEGYLARAPGYEPRPGQVTLARAIDEAIRTGKHLVAEGPCGIGKSKAYLVPAIHFAVTAGKRVLVATSSIALQEQLIRKDLPDLARELPWSFDYALLKGRTNYVCLEQRDQATNAGLHEPLMREFVEVARWARSTETGDKTDLPILPQDAVWSRFSMTSDMCPGKERCKQHAECFATIAKGRASQAHVVVTNYHMLVLHLMHERRVLPPFDVVIMDEAHELPDIAREFRGFSVSRNAFFRLAQEAQRRGESALAAKLRDVSSAYFDTLKRFAASPYYKNMLQGEVPIDLEPLRVVVGEFTDRCCKSLLVDYARTSIERVTAAAQQSDENTVYWIDVSEAGHAAYRSKDVYVAEFFRRELWGNTPSVIAVSATLTSEGRFQFVRGELGVPNEARELVVPSPFDIEHNALLVLPEGMPDPRDPAFPDAAAQQIIRVIDACGGRTMCLFTSYESMRAIHERVARHYGGRVRILRQGDMARNVLADEFKRDIDSVLFAVGSFWTGIDVPGPSLTGLVIEKLPFISRSDPVLLRMMEKDRRRAFVDYMVPRSILPWRQGVGRLIRTRRDFGVVVALDPRLTTEAYGARFLSSLPQMLRATSTDAIPFFLRRHGVAA
ncbi:ATP-dependent DNA helicase [Pendulispora brunnea]|uniref:ATP-dependent DNA helicase n=1 Tax=Pendulispora brunnea TaxID=2905690 RepID=A0ABZ2KHD1_9BACT